LSNDYNGNNYIAQDMVSRAVNQHIASDDTGMTNDRQLVMAHQQH